MTLPDLTAFAPPPRRYTVRSTPLPVDARVCPKCEKPVKEASPTLLVGVNRWAHTLCAVKRSVETAVAINNAMCANCGLALVDHECGTHGAFCRDRQRFQLAVSEATREAA